MDGGVGRDLGGCSIVVLVDIAVPGVTATPGVTVTGTTAVPCGIAVPGATVFDESKLAPTPILPDLCTDII